MDQFAIEVSSEIFKAYLKLEKDLLDDDVLGYFAFIALDNQNVLGLNFSRLKIGQDSFEEIYKEGDGYDSYDFQIHGNDLSPRMFQHYSPNFDKALFTKSQFDFIFNNYSSVTFSGARIDLGETIYNSLTGEYGTTEFFSLKAEGSYNINSNSPDEPMIPSIIVGSPCPPWWSPGGVSSVIPINPDRFWNYANKKIKVQHVKGTTKEKGNT